MGARGTGASKRRSSEQARKAVQTRWTRASQIKQELLAQVPPDLASCVRAIR